MFYFCWQIMLKQLLNYFNRIGVPQVLQNNKSELKKLYFLFMRKYKLDLF